MSIRYVWLNIETGEFSNSWDEKDQQLLDLEATINPAWKLIKYECLNDQDFKFYNLMKVVTNTPKLKQKPEVFILSFSKHQADGFAAGQESKPIYIDAAAKLRGLEGNGKTLFVLDRAWDNPRYHEILEEAKIRGFSIQYV